MMKHICRAGIYIAFLFITACSKPDPVVPPTPPVPPDPVTGQPVDLTTPGGDCQIIKLSQKNNSGTTDDNVYEIQRTGVQMTPQNIGYTDNLKAQNNYSISIRSAGDTIGLSTGEYFLVNP